MVTIQVGDLFESKSQTLVNAVNCAGVMGKGIALDFKRRFPEMFKDYVLRCGNGEVRPGQPYLFRNPQPPWILNFPTKKHWRSSSRIADIAMGLEYLAKRYRQWGIESLALPALGCGHGQLEWKVVGPLLYRGLLRFDIPVELYAPLGAVSKELEVAFLSGAGSGRVAEVPDRSGPMISKPILRA